MAKRPTDLINWWKYVKKCLSKAVVIKPKIMFQIPSNQDWGRSSQPTWLVACAYSRIFPVPESVWENKQADTVPSSGFSAFLVVGACGGESRVHATALGFSTGPASSGTQSWKCWCSNGNLVEEKQNTYLVPCNEGLGGGRISLLVQGNKMRTDILNL